MSDKLRQTSKFLSLILRHKPEVIGITLDKNGWADVSELISGVNKTGKYSLDMKKLEEIVHTDDKQRYSFNSYKNKIRANQGHSIQVDVELKECQPPEFLWHGTGEKYVDSINSEGLKPKSRLYVHLSGDIETAVKVGSRHGKPVIYRINSGEMYRQGYVFICRKTEYGFLISFCPISWKKRNLHMNENIIIRPANPDDAENILSVYAPYIEKTAVTFEYTIPEISEFRKRIETTLKNYPYIVAEKEKNIIGYAYTGKFSERKAYCHSAEISVYIDAKHTKSGIGRKLYNTIEKISAKQNIFNLNACVAVPVEKEDEYLTRNSITFHQHMGYNIVGEFHKCGYKFGRWYNMMWLEKIICQHSENPDPFISFMEVDYGGIL